MPAPTWARINPRTPGGFGRTPTPGGGLISAPPTISNTTHVREKRKTAFGRLGEKHYKKHSDNFPLKSKLRSPEVIKGKIFPNFGITMTWLHIMRIISVPVTATSKFKKAIESSWNALSLRWRQISPKTNGLGVRGHERSKTAFLSETVFRW